MNNQSIEERIQALDQKVDLLLSYVNEQRLRNQALQDLVDDVSIVGKDLYDTAVNTLDKQSVEIDPDTLSILFTRFLKNIPNFSFLLESMESMVDLAKDAGPIVNEVIIDTTRKLHQFEEKGYFSIVKETTTIFENVLSHFTVEDVRQLADNVVTILETIKTLTQPEMMQAINSAVQVFNSVEQGDIPSYSFPKALMEMRKPEMKKALGFALMFLKNLSQNASKSTN